MTNQEHNIIRWQMTEAETKAYRVACMWESQVKKVFPELKSYSRLPRSGDPRNSNLFRYCWKLMRETRGLLKEDDYKLYIIANLHILKIHNGRVEPNALCGDKAWYRWLVWKKHFDRKSQQMAGDRHLEEKQVDPRFFREIGLTKRFLFEKCEGEPTYDKIGEFCQSPKMRIWLGAKVTPYYMLLSPWIDRLYPDQSWSERYQIEPTVFEQKLDDSCRAHFQKEFSHEFDNLPD